MQDRHYSRSLIAALTLLVALVLAAVAMAMPRTVDVKGYAPGAAGKTLKIARIDNERARLTIVARNGDRSSIVVYGGDVRLGLWGAGVHPER